MKIHIVWGDIDYSGGIILKVFQSEAAAKEFLGKCISIESAESIRRFDGYSLTEEDVIMETEK